jgi:hypothetical protein
MKDCFYTTNNTGKRVCKYFWDYLKESTYIQPPTVGCDILQIDPAQTESNDFLNIKGVRIVDGPEAMFTRDFRLIVGEGWRKFFLTSDSFLYPPIVFIRGIELPTTMERFYIQGPLPLDYLILNCPKVDKMDTLSVAGIPNLRTLNMICVGCDTRVEYGNQAIHDLPRLQTLIFPKRATTKPQAVRLVGNNTESGCDVTLDSVTLGSCTFSKSKINRMTLKGTTYDFDPGVTSIDATTTVKELYLHGDWVDNLLNQRSTGVRLRLPPPNLLGLNKIIFKRDKFSRELSTEDFARALDLMGYHSHIDLVKFESDSDTTTE